MSNAPSDGPLPPAISLDPESSSAARLTALRVLVVDDLQDAAESLAVLLRMLGYQVRTAHDGQAALCVAAEFQPHAILLDLAMPKLHGLAVAQQIKQRPATQLPCLIAISGYGQSADVISTRAAGFDHHMIKPVAAKELHSILQSFCVSKR